MRYLGEDTKLQNRFALVYRRDALDGIATDLAEIPRHRGSACSVWVIVACQILLARDLNLLSLDTKIVTEHCSSQDRAVSRMLRNAWRGGARLGWGNPKHIRDPATFRQFAQWQR